MILQAFSLFNSVVDAVATQQHRCLAPQIRVESVQVTDIVHMCVGIEGGWLLNKWRGALGLRGC
jgi:hypothetical protein